MADYTLAVDVGAFVLVGLPVQFADDTAEIEVRQVKSGRGLLKSFAVLNVNAATRYLYLFDSLSSAGSLVCAPVKLATGESFQLSFTVPRTFTTGLRANASSGAAGTFTTSGTKDLVLQAQYT